LFCCGLKNNVFKIRSKTFSLKNYVFKATVEPNNHSSFTLKNLVCKTGKKLSGWLKESLFRGIVSENIFPEKRVSVEVKPSSSRNSFLKNSGTG